MGPGGTILMGISPEEGRGFELSRKKREEEEEEKTGIKATRRIRLLEKGGHRHPTHSVRRQCGVKPYKLIRAKKGEDNEEQSTNQLTHQSIWYVHQNFRKTEGNQKNAAICRKQTIKDLLGRSGKDHARKVPVREENYHGSEKIAGRRRVTVIGPNGKVV